MGWTYSGRPDSSTKDEVRFLVGDVYLDNQIVSDEEIGYSLSVHSIVQKAAAMVCRAIAARFSSKVSMSAAGVSKSCSDLSKAYEQRAKELESSAQGIVPFVLPSFGGNSKLKKETLAANEDAVQPSFFKGMSDNPNTT